MLLTAATLSLLTLLLSLPLTLYARRGQRLDTHPTCRRCHFDLYNKPATSTQCPECGQDLTKPHATRIGNRAPRTKLLLTSLLFALLSFSTLSYTSYRLYKSTNLWQFAPTWYLTHSLASTDLTIRKNAINEIFTRSTRNALSRADQLRIVSAILALQADTAHPFDPNLALLLDRFLFTRGITLEDLHPYLTRGFRFANLTLRPRRSDTDPLIFQLTTEGRYLTPDNLNIRSFGTPNFPTLPATVHATITVSARINGQWKDLRSHEQQIAACQRPPFTTFRTTPALNALNTFQPVTTLHHFIPSDFPNLPPGPTPLRVTITPHFNLQNIPDTPQTFETTYTHVATPEENVRPLTSPYILNGTSLVGGPTLSRSDPTSLRLNLSISNLPAPISFDIYLSPANSPPSARIKIGEVAATDNLDFDHTFTNPFRPSITTYDLHFLPSRTPAAATPNQDSYLDAPLTFLNVSTHGYTLPSRPTTQPRKRTTTPR